MDAATNTSPRKRGRPPKAKPEPQPPIPAMWISPEQAARHLGVSLPTLWRGVRDGSLTPPSYPVPKAPRFNLLVLDRDMERARAKPSDAEGYRRLAEARALAAARRGTRAVEESRLSP